MVCDWQVVVRDVLWSVIGRLIKQLFDHATSQEGRSVSTANNIAPPRNRKTGSSHCTSPLHRLHGIDCQGNVLMLLV